MCCTHDGQCGWGVGGAMSVVKDIHLPVTLNCAQEFVLGVMFRSFSALTIKYTTIQAVYK